jgi:maleylpyruvate isomerase
VRLYTYWRSSSAWRVRVVAAMKGVALEQVAVNLAPGAEAQRAPAHLRRNPMGQVPTLAWEEDGETRWLSQSMAIIDYLERRFPAPPVFPAAPYARARAIQLAEMVNAGIQPLQNSGTLARLERAGALPRPFAAEAIAHGLAALDAEARREPYDFLMGPGPTIADVYLVPQLYNARRFGVDLAPFARLREVEARCADLPAFASAHPDAQADRPGGPD